MDYIRVAAQYFTGFAAENYVFEFSTDNLCIERFRHMNQGFLGESINDL
jgi:hypothetical protein